MSRADEERVRQEFERRHPGIKFPPLHGSYLVDIEGNVYKRAASGGWRATGKKKTRRLPNFRMAFRRYIRRKPLLDSLYMRTQA